MFLIIIKGTNAGNVYPLNKIGPIIIGREKDCDIRILELMISRRHCQIEKKEDNIFYIKDLNSTNKTFLNRRVVEEEQRLNLNDIIEVGNTTLLFTDRAELSIKSMEEYEKFRKSQTVRIDLPPK